MCREFLICRELEIKGNGHVNKIAVTVQAVRFTATNATGKQS